MWWKILLYIVDVLVAAGTVYIMHIAIRIFRDIKDGVNNI